VRRRSTTLIDEIERGALDPKVPISTPLRQLVALGGQAGSAELREWASLELRGYVASATPLPEYRKPGAVLRIDGGTFNAMITGQLISPNELPEGIREHIDETVPLRGGVAEIEAMIEHAKREAKGEIKLTLPGGQDIVRLMNYEIQQRGEAYDRVTAIYWSVSHVTLEGVIDQIRTRLVELVAEMRAAMPDEADLPTPDAADNAVSIVIHGGNPRVRVNAAQATGTGSHSVTAGTASERVGAWKRVGGFIVGVAIVVGTIVAVAAWQNWNPF
jgi:hypothetical protein